MSDEVDPREALVQRALRLAYQSVGWDLAAGLLAVVAGLIAGSIALVGFGFDSLIETLAGGLLVWRLSAQAGGTLDEDVAIEVQLRARRFIGLAFIALAAYVAYQSVLTLMDRQAPAPSPLGIGLLVVSIALTLWLARAKRRVGEALEDPTLIADARRTVARCSFAVVALAGLVLNAVGGLWWADPVAGLGIALLLLREAFEALRGEVVAD